MRALSVKQPWAWFICSFKGAGGLEPQRIVNHGRLKNIKGPCLIHTGTRFDDEGYVKIMSKISAKYPEVATSMSKMRPESFQLGGIVGWADFTGEYVTESDDFWFLGKNGLFLRDAGELFFLKCTGSIVPFNCDYPMMPKGM